MNKNDVYKNETVKKVFILSNKMNTKTLMKKLFVSTYAVEVCRNLNEIDVKHCCCCIQKRNTECLMLWEDEKIEVHFDRAYRTVSVEKVIGKVMDLIKLFQLTIEVEAELYCWDGKQTDL